MKLGILLCDRVQSPLQAEFGDYPQMFASIIQKARPEISIVPYYAVDGQLPAELDECDVYLCSGSKWGVNDSAPWIRQLEDFVRALYQAQKGFVGICFGHQMIARALGGEVQKADQGWGVGVAQSHVISAKPWMDPSPCALRLIVSHQDQISRLPPASEVLMQSEFCPYSMIQVSGHFLGVQGHPEFSPAYSAALMEVRRDRIPAARISAGLDSLLQPVDDVRAMQWILNFLSLSHSNSGKE